MTKAWAMVALFTCGLAAGCGLRRDILEPPPVDGSVPTSDGRPFDAVDAQAGCTQTFVPGVGCTEASLACIPAGVCPDSWAAAQTQTTCTGNGEITLDACGSVFRWIHLERSYTWCYYDAATLALQGARLDTGSPVYCLDPGDAGSSEILIGTIPAGCETGDGGTVFSTSSCFDAGAGEAGD